jgi:hypothetical protein
MVLEREGAAEAGTHEKLLVRRGTPLYHHNFQTRWLGRYVATFTPTNEHFFHGRKESQGALTDRGGFPSLGVHI